MLWSTTCIPCLTAGILCMLHIGRDVNSSGRVSALKCIFPNQHQILSASAGKWRFHHGRVFHFQPPSAVQVSSLTWSERAGQGTLCKSSSSLYSSQVCTRQQTQPNYCLLELHPRLLCVCVCPSRANSTGRRVGHQTNSPPWEGGQFRVLQNSRAGTWERTRNQLALAEMPGTEGGFLPQGQ